MFFETDQLKAARQGRKMLIPTDQLVGLLNEFADQPPHLGGLGSVEAMFDRVLVAPRSPTSGPVHPTDVGLSAEAKP